MPVIDKATPEFQRIRNKLPTGAIRHRRFGLRLRSVVQRSARRIGGELSNEVAQSVELRTGTASGTLIVNSDAGYQREYGGTIQAKSSLLKVPINNGADDGEDLVFIPSKSGDPNTVGVLGSTSGDAFTPRFVLRTQVTTEAKPWFPSARTLLDNVVAEEMAMLTEAGI